ncbi:tRNA (Uracil-5-)-methyltransferase [Besnoitia besnoiti]|uniref:tRNA (Uracil-5-)-methyltransferase n=1 Tax=Besnoitia besnoiti TaxID=94643 RepID=A0A2A9MJG0_BESBE|nr:tRNA (Uracil-5-)-methyltransferase [Besnoitia besnoiti]PFH37324.1 tRNA (Uracil-5-)-methyltransferase [Besnoitia besnoiti]
MTHCGTRTGSDSIGIKTNQAGTAAKDLRPRPGPPSAGDIVLVHIQFILDTGEGFGSVRTPQNDSSAQGCLRFGDEKRSGCKSAVYAGNVSGEAEAPVRFAPVSSETSPTLLASDFPNIMTAAMNEKEDCQWPVFVPFSIPGETVWVRIHNTFARHSSGFIVAHVGGPSPRRSTPPCPYFGMCSGCQYQHMPLQMQHSVKREHVRGVLRRLAGLPWSIVVNKVVSDNQLGGYHYRSKITPHYSFYREGSIPAVGYNCVKSPRRVLEIQSCKLALPSINEKLTELRKQVSVQAQTPSASPATKSRRKGATLLLCDNGQNAVTSDPAALCAATDVDGLQCWYRAGDFFQVNRRVLPLLVSHVREQLRDARAYPSTRACRRLLLDCYCGVGLFALACHDDFEAVVGFDVCASSIELARYNAQCNSKWRARFETSDARNFFDSFPAELSPSDTTRVCVVVDPPRKGCDTDFLRRLIKLSPERIVYISCHPATQARDVKILREAYTVTNVQPFDMFPHTRHIECVVTLERCTEDQAGG